MRRESLSGRGLPRQSHLSWKASAIFGICVSVAAGVPFTSTAISPECNTGIGHATRFKFSNLKPGTVYELSNGTRILAIGTADCVRWIIVEKSDTPIPNKPRDVILSDKSK